MPIEYSMHRVAELGRDLAQDVDALGFEAVEVAQVDRQGHRQDGWVAGVRAGMRAGLLTVPAVAAI